MINSRAASLPKPLVLTAFDLMQSSNDGASKFLQESNFLWLTGISEPGWLVVVDEQSSHLISPKQSPSRDLFEGGLSSDEAREVSGADRVLSNKEGLELIKSLAKEYDTVYTLGPEPHESCYEFNLNLAPARLRKKLARLFNNTGDCRLELAKLRAIKSADELQSIRKAVDVTVEAFNRVRQDVGKLAYEYQIEAEMTHAIRSAGADGHAYEPIVAGGSNSLTLHYGANSDALPKGGLVLIDVGARVDGYAADITRTYAVGKPTDREVQVHRAVQKAHFAIIDLIRPGVSLADYVNKSDAIMKGALRDLGLIGGGDDDESELLREYFPHSVSHGLGLDVHETLGGFKHFRPGMVLTVEPGIYIEREGIGVRIEDDILVTKTGNENLSRHLSTNL